MPFQFSWSDEMQKQAENLVYNQMPNEHDLTL